MYIKHFVGQLVCHSVTFYLSTRGHTFFTQRRGVGTNIFHTHQEEKHFYINGGLNIFTSWGDIEEGCKPFYIMGG